MRRISQSAVWICAVGALLCGSTARAEVIVVTQNVNLRPEQSVAYPPIRQLTPSEPPMELIEPHPLDGYYHVKTSAGEEGYVWTRAVQVAVTPPTAFEAGGIQLGPGIPGSPDMKGCGDRLWKHVYHPTRLLVRNDCVTITGVIVDATADQATHEKDGVRHEGDGDTHGWLKVDSQFADLLNEGNASAEGGNLVFELACHYKVTQKDALSACKGFSDHTAIPKVGTRVAIRGTFVQEKNHAKWNEIHPVSSIQAQ